MKIKTEKIMSEKKSNKKYVILLGILDILAIICFILVYAVPYVKNFVITTAMTTMSHKWIARTFYSEKTINNVLSKNKISNFSFGTDASKVVIGSDEDISFASHYEKELLEHKKDEDYKLIKFQHKGYNCFLVAMYDPTRVELMLSTYVGQSGQYLTAMASDHKAKVAINAGGFIDADSSGVAGTGNGGIPAGVVIKDGKLLYGSGYGTRELAGFNKDGILVLSYTTANNAIANGMKDAIEFGPFLIVNGVSAKVYGNGGWGINPRTILAQRRDGIVLFLVVDGNGTNKYNWNGRGGLEMGDIITLLERYGAYNAVNMDGGASTTLVVENKLVNKPCGYSETGERRLPNGWMFK